MHADGEGRAEWLPARHVPQPDTMVEAARGQCPAVGAERHAGHDVHVAAEGAERLPAGHVPQPDGAITATRGQRLAVGAERYAPYNARVAGEGHAARLPARHVP